MYAGTPHSSVEATPRQLPRTPVIGEKRLADGLVDLQSTDDGARRAKLLDQLLRTMPGSDRECSTDG